MVGAYFILEGVKPSKHKLACLLHSLVKCLGQEHLKVFKELFALVTIDQNVLPYLDGALRHDPAVGPVEHESELPVHFQASDGTGPRRHLKIKRPI